MSSASSTTRGKLAVAAGLIALISLAAVADGAASQEQQRISGVVIDDRTEQPIQGALVAIEGEAAEALTDGRGRFSIATSAAAGVPVEVVVQRLGYRTEVHSAQAGGADVSIRLTTAPLDLDAVVVTGTAGGERRRALGHGMGEVRVADQLEYAPARDISQMLNARVPGLVVHSSGGGVGVSSYTRIRGRSSFALAGAPLLYVDGVRVNNAIAGNQLGYGPQFNPMDDIDPSSIETIEVIKGPAAATLYGTEASAGIINITTRRGTPGQAQQLNVSMRQGAGWLLDAENRYPLNFWRNPDNGQVVAMNLTQLERQRGTPVFRTGHQQGISAQLTGGAESVGYNVNFSYDDDEGATIDNWARRLSGRAALTLTPHQTVTVGVTTGVTRNNTRVADDEMLWRVIMGHPSTLDTPLRGHVYEPHDAHSQMYRHTSDVNRTMTSVTAQHRPTDWLTHRLAVGVDRTNQEFTTLRPFLTPELAQWVSDEEARGSKNVNKQDVDYLSLDYAATLTTSLTPRLGSSTSAGVQLYRKRIDYTNLTGREFVGPGITSIAGAVTRQGSDNQLENSTVGVYFQEQLSWQDRLYLTGAVRIDNNSAFGSDFEWVVYPKVSASWVVSDEPFWNVGFLDVMRLRAAYGQSGEQPDAFAAVRTFTPIQGTGDQAAVMPGQVGNPDLRPERGSELEFGVDFSVANDRLGGELTYYNTRVTDAILSRNVPPSSGFYPATQFINAGELANRGYEALLRARLMESRRFDWDMTVNLSHNTSEVLSLGDVDALDVGWVPNRHQVGYPLAAFFMRRVVSADAGPDGQPINIMCDGGPGAAPVPCDEAPAVYVGKPDPHLTGSVSSTFTLLQRVRVFALFDFIRGKSAYDYVEHVRCLSLGMCEELVHPERFSTMHLAHYEVAQDWDGSGMVPSFDFTKLREVSLNYAVPSAWADRVFRASRASITLSARNLHTWSSYRGPDPEIVYETPQSEYDMDSPWTDTNVPPLTQFSFTVNLTF